MNNEEREYQAGQEEKLEEMGLDDENVGYKKRERDEDDVMENERSKDNLIEDDYGMDIANDR